MKYRELKIGTTLKRLRMENQLSQADLAKRSSIDIKTIELLENNNIDLPLGTFLSLAASFKMMPSEFMEEVQKDS